MAAGKVTRRKGREIRRPLPPAARAAVQEGVNESGFRIPAPRGIRPMVNARVPVGDERLEEGLYVPPEEELDDLGEGQEEGTEEDAYDPQSELEEEQFTEPLPVLAAPAARTRRPPVAPMQRAAVPPAVQPPAAAPQTGLTLPAVEIEDTDRIWDWVRIDADKGAAFFGKALSNSMELHDMMKGYLIAEQQGTGCVRSIYWNDAHLGVMGLQPIMSTERVAVLHAYLSPAARPSMPRLLVGLVALALQLVPGYHVGLMALTPAQHKLYGELLSPHGFKPHTLFIR